MGRCQGGVFMNQDRRIKLTERERQQKKEIFRKARPAVDVKRGDVLTGQIYNIIDEGAFVLTTENFIGFVHASEITQPLKIGMNLEGRVTFVRADGRINLSLKPPKEVARVADAEKIKTYMMSRGGSMPFNDDTPADVIMNKFGISKAAFKRALGKLFKEGQIEEVDGWIGLKNGVEQ